MTLYKYDESGWYVGELLEGISDTSRTTDKVPPILSVSEEEGLRSIYFNDQWNILPYIPPVDPPADSGGAYTLEDLKSLKIQELSSTLLVKLHAPITVGGVTYTTSASMREKFLGLSVLSEPPVDAFLLDANDSVVPVTSIADIKAVVLAIANREVALYKVFMQLSHIVDACTTSEAVEAVTWP